MNPQGYIMYAKSQFAS